MIDLRVQHRFWCHKKAGRIILVSTYSALRFVCLSNFKPKQKRNDDDFPSHYRRVRWTLYENIVRTWHACDLHNNGIRDYDRLSDIDMEIYAQEPHPWTAAVSAKSDFTTCHINGDGKALDTTLHIAIVLNVLLSNTMCARHVSASGWCT